MGRDFNPHLCFVLLLDLLFVLANDRAYTQYQQQMKQIEANSIT